MACAHGEGGEVSKHASAILPKPLSSTSVSLLDEFASSSPDLLPLHAHQQSHSTCDDNLRNTCSDRHGLHAQAQPSQLSCDRSSGSNGSEGSDSKRFDDSNHGKALNGHNSDSSAETKHLDPPSQKSANTDTAGQGDSTQKSNEAHSSVPTDVPRQCSAFSAYNAAKAATRSERNEGCDSCVKPAMVMPPALTLHWHAVQAFMSGEEGCVAQRDGSSRGDHPVCRARGRSGTHPAFHVEHSRHGKQMEYRRTPQQRQRKVQPLERAKLQNKLKHGKQPGARRKEEHYDHDRQYKARAAALQRYRRKRMKARGPAQPPDSKDASRKGVDAEMAC